MARFVDTLGIALITLLAAVAGPASAASLTGRVAVTSKLLDLSIQRPGTGGGPTLSDDFFVTPGSNAVGTGNSSAAYEASFGQLRGRASLQTFGPGTLPFGFDIDGGANGEAAWNDVVTISAPGMAGQSGTFRIRLDLDGSVEGHAAGANLAQGGACADFGDPLGLWESTDIGFTYGSALPSRGRASSI